MTDGKPLTETYLTLMGLPGSHPIEERQIVTTGDYSESFIVDRVVTLADGSWQATAVPSRIWRSFERA